MKNSSISENKDEFDFEIFIEFLFRNKFKLFLISFISISISLFYALSRRHIWEGQFQIVISNNNNKPSTFSKDTTFDISNLIASSNIDLKTDVEILKSPSVLAPVFNYVQADQTKKRRKEILVYSKWLKENLSINLERGTSVLNLSYRDKDKSLIIPVLNKISTEYKKYSGRKRRKDLKSGLEFTSKQIKVYEKKSAESYAKAQKYAIENKFELPSLKRQEKFGFFSIEEKLSEVQENIKYAETQLKKVKLIDEESTSVSYYLPIDLEFNNESLIEEISNYDTLISRAKLIYKKEDEYLKELERKKGILNKQLKKELILFLEANKLDAEVQLKSLIKPENVLIEYRKILNKAIQDQKTLEQLNMQFRYLSLEQSKNDDPWELITTPTLLPEPVAPNKKRVLALGSLFGILLGGSVIKLIENKKGLTFSLKELKKFINLPLISVISIEDLDGLEKSFEILLAGLNSNNIDEIGILNIGNKNKYFYEQINKYLKKNYSGKFLLSHNLADLKKFKNIILSIEVGSTFKNSYYELINSMKFQNKNTIGYLAISNESKNKIL